MEEISTQDLTRCETVIAAGLHTFWEVGEALAEVRDKRLWSGQYENFNDYLAKRWKLKPLYAGKLMLAANIRSELSEHSAPAENGRPRFDLPDSLSGACALKTLDTEQKVRVLEQLHEKNLPVTQQNIKLEMEEICPPSPKIPKLSYGILRNSIDALVKQSAFFDSVTPDKLGELFESHDDREFAIEALTRIVELLSSEQ